MNYKLTDGTIKALLRLELALTSPEQDDLNELVSEIKELYEKALTIQELKNEFNSGSYDT
jgi:hypothetical protein